ncbi:RNA-directed DNA polymerase, eukaryota [Tanacetum coccineum]
MSVQYNGTLFLADTVIHRGKTFWIRAFEVPGWVPEFNDDLDYEDDHEENISNDGASDIHIKDITDKNSEGEEIPETVPETDDAVKSRIEEVFKDMSADKSEDPFNLYTILNKNKGHNGNGHDSGSSLQYPPGFSPSVKRDDKVDDHVIGAACSDDTARMNNKDEYPEVLSECQGKCNSNGNGAESNNSGYFKKSEVPRTGGSIIGILDEVVRVGQTMGYRMEGVISNMTEIIASQGVEEETKMENMEDFCVRHCWGNSTYDHVHSDAVGNSGGILCVWDPNVYCKSSSTVSDSFVITRGHWRLSRNDMMVIAIYAPQDNRDKQCLWEYLHQVISKWKGDVIIMGDFNEVRLKSDRFGCNYNPLGAKRFNEFIMGSGLVEVNLGGSHFTWCHKSAKKMSKLDRFLVTGKVF